MPELEAQSGIGSIRQLKSLLPTDARFVEAISSEEQVSPVSWVERNTMIEKDAESLKAFEQNNFELAQSIGDIAKQIEISIQDKEKSYTLVKNCAEDAFACMEMETRARNFIRAGEWKVLFEKLQSRLSIEEQLKSRNRVGVKSSTNSKRKSEGNCGVPQATLLGGNAHDEDELNDTIIVTVRKELRSRKRKVPVTLSSFEDKLHRSYKWKGIEYDNFLNQSFSYANGETYCCCCEVKIDIIDWAQHVHGHNVKEGKLTKHKYALEKFYRRNDPTSSSSSSLSCSPATTLTEALNQLPLPNLKEKGPHARV